MAKPSDLGELVNNEHEKQAKASSAGEGGLEKKTNEDTGWNFRQVAKDFLKFSPWMIGNFLMSGGWKYLKGEASLISASASFLSPVGLLGGKLIENWKTGKKTTWTEARKEIGTGNFVGNLAYWLYSIPDYLVNYFAINTATVSGMLAKTAMFNPGMLIPFVAAYMPFVYLRDKIGVKKSLKGLYNGKIFGYVNEAYETDMKKNYWPTVKKTFMTLFPIHIISLNYVKLPALRVAIGSFNDILFRLIAGKKKEGEETAEHAEKVPLYQKAKSYINSIPKKIDNFFRVPGYEPEPAYAGAH